MAKVEATFKIDASEVIAAMERARANEFLEWSDWTSPNSRSYGFRASLDEHQALLVFAGESDGTMFWILHVGSWDFRFSSTTTPQAMAKAGLLAHALRGMGPL